MSADSTLIDRIVHGVLTQLANAGEERATARPQASQAAVAQAGGNGTIGGVEITERIVTAEVLCERAKHATVVSVGSRAIVTPAAWDVVRERGLTLSRGGAKPQASTGSEERQNNSGGRVSLAPLLIVVRHTPSVDRLYEDLKTTWRRELLGCLDDAAKLAISAIARGETNAVAILAVQTHRAACLANRNEVAKAVAVRDAADVPVVRKQLRANVWCVDPTDRSWFEMRNLLRAIGE